VNASTPLKHTLLVLALAATGAFAQTPPASPPAAPASAAAVPWTAAEVRKLDLASGRVTLKHADIVNLDMPAMTMVFRATDPQALQALQTGDRVRFVAGQSGSEYTVLRIEKLAP
jgi:Cu/Ag efflux protein CusF